MTYKRQWPHMPADEYLPPDLAKLHAEACRIDARRTEAIAERHRLATPEAEEAALTADQEAASVGLRAGKSMREVGTPAMDELVKTRHALDAEIGAADLALKDIELEMQPMFAALQDDDTVSGRTALKATEKAYRKALDALPALRAAYVNARTLHDFFASAAGVPGVSTLWPTRDAGVKLDNLSRVGERDYNLRPQPADTVIERTFARDFERRTNS